MSVAAGVLLGPYEILAQIGSGGMGDVWRARDQRIGRDVALKVLPEAYGDDDPRVKRFEQEARAAGALNHPGLVTIFDVGTTDGAPYIVMELLEGETLRDVLGPTDPAPLPAKKAIEYGQQLASALAVAHEKGIIHRDLKPENIFITSDRRVKILDFGLAKLAEVAENAGDARTTARHLTSAGMVVGTPGYMSPEQVRAQPLDHRTDIFAFGTVLYEMLTGTSPFERDSAIETMHAVLSAELPSLSAVDPAIPPALDAIVAHCLEKNPRDRAQSARDLAFQLRMFAEPQSATGVRFVRRLKNLRVPRAVLAVLAFVAVGASGFALREFAVAPRMHARTFQQLTFGGGLESFPALAPDGKSFAYVSSAETGNPDIFVQRVDGRAALNLTADSPEADSEPAFSPDGSQIAFRSDRDGGGIFVMGVTGESVRRLTAEGFNPSWSPDSTRIVFSTTGVALQPHIHRRSGDLWIVDARTGAKRMLKASTAEGGDGMQPSWSPHGKRIAYYSVGGAGPTWDIWTIEPDAPVPAKTIVRVTSDPMLDWNPVWAPDGKSLYFGSGRDGTLNLWRVGIDEETGEPRGEPEPLSLPGQNTGQFTVSQNGDLAFATVTRSYRIVALPFDAETGRTGTPQPLFGGPQEIASFAPSPDGTSIAFTTGGVREDLFLANADGSRLRQLTNDVAQDRAVTWSQDGKLLYFTSNSDGPSHVWRIAADGSGLTRVTDDRDLQRVGKKNLYRPSISPDGRTLAVPTGDDAQTLVHLDRPPGRRLEPLPSYVGMPKWSPDGQRIAGTRGRDIVVYSLRTRTSEKTGARGASPQWLPDGRRIVFRQDQSIGILDLETRRQIVTPFSAAGLTFDFRSVLSADGRTLYVSEILEQGDVLLMREIPD